MQNLLDSLASWATILGFALTLIGIVQSQTWLTIASIVFIAGSIVAGVYARKERLTLDSAAVKIEGRSIDALNAANLRRVVNRSLVVQAVRRVVTVDGQDLEVVVEYAGYCQAARETKFDFSIDSDRNIPFDDLQCTAYDLIKDPDRQHAIRPMLVGPDGISKKLAVPFLEPLTTKKPFLILLAYRLPRSMTSGVDYYSATLSFAQERVPISIVRLIFKGVLPDWIRVYEVNASGRVALMKTLQSVDKTIHRRDYIDNAEDLPSRSARVYVFSRPVLKEAMSRSKQYG